MSKDNMYRMLVLLEEEMEEPELFDNDTTDSKATEPKKTHEFIEELLLPFEVSELDALNKWFDKFDEEICIPNEGHIKYEISSDGLIVLLLDKEIENVISEVKKFIDDNQDLNESE
ncbi:hypothetical protein NCAS_0B01100 [Naumovozyma castellii]|uniref:Uncharacterized protein n=1 Tax=Naumovozyma castellii TaxID=27288 RepID=G0VB70_NAUCA|nr:hypothetical protein NCAS_0B01100 [Naumovozyma castellii CBS 4309]CCC68194.1 hypothetical protein NCAS_0B01100 [Naumovozyma castellii CBS 4309]